MPRKSGIQKTESPKRTGKGKRGSSIITPRVKLARFLYALMTQPKGLSRDFIKETFDIRAERTLRDYVAALKQIPELYQNGESQVRVQGEGRNMRIVLRSQEPDHNICKSVASIYFALSMFRFLKGTCLEKRADEIYQSIYKGTDRKFLFDLDKKIYSLNEWAKDYKRKAPVIDKCLRALIGQKELSLEYRSLGKSGVSHHDFKPLTLLQYRNGLYLLGKSRQKEGKIINLAIERIQSIHVTGKGFQYPPNYSPHDYFSEEFGIFKGDKSHKVVLEFHKRVKDIILSRQWGKSARIEKRDDGFIRVSFRTSSLTQVLPFVLSFGCYAKVLQPKELRAKIAAELPRIMKLYPSRK